MMQPPSVIRRDGAASVTTTPTVKEAGREAVKQQKLEEKAVTD